MQHAPPLDPHTDAPQRALSPARDTTTTTTAAAEGHVERAGAGSAGEILSTGEAALGGKEEAAGTLGGPLDAQGDTTGASEGRGDGRAEERAGGAQLLVEGAPRVESGDEAHEGLETRVLGARGGEAATGVGAADGEVVAQGGAGAPALVQEGGGGGALPLEQPRPSNPARATSSLLALPPSSASIGAASSDAALSALGGTATEADASAATPHPAAARTASPALSASPGPGGAPAAERPLPPKKFQSSLAVNKKFLEKAGEKAKPEVKPVIARLATSPAPAPATNTSHPRLLAGKLSSGPSITLSTAASSAASSPGSWGAKKPATPTPASSAAGGSSTPAPVGQQGKGPVWGAPTAAGAGAGAGQPHVQHPQAAPQPQAYVSGGMHGRQRHGAEPGWGGAGRRMEMDFPTAAEAANVQDARQKAIAEQTQARERASQARAAAAAAHNAHLLEELDAFRGVHLDPNAAHWDEADDDDFLDTTIEFADGTQYKLDTAPQTPAAEEELREPGPRELALRERPLAPGEVVVPPKRQERFGDDYDRSWPRRLSERGGEGRTLFNDRLGKLEPAASGASAAHPPARHGGEPTSILRPGAGGHAADAPPHLALGGHVPPPTSGRRPSITSPRMNTHAPLHPAGRRESFHEPARPVAWGGAGTRRPSMTAGATAGAGAAQDRQLPPHLAARGAPQAQAPLSPPRARRPSVPAAAAVLPTSPTRVAAPALSRAAVTATAPAPAPPTSAVPAGEAAAPPPSIEELHAREMHAAAERAKKRREEEEQKRLEQIERARRKALELEERMKAQEEVKAKERREKEEAARPKVAERRPSVAAAAVAMPIAPADKATSWRAAAKPLPPAPAPPASAAAVAKSPVAAPPKDLAREQHPAAAASAQPTSILPRPPVAKVAPSAQAPTQPSAWRRTGAAAPSAPPAPSGRAPLRQLPPHLAAQAEAKAAAAAAAAAVAPRPEQAPAPTIAQPAAAVEESAKPSTPPAQPAATLASPPTSPAHDRRAQQQQAAAAAKLGYKLPAVSQFDDLMSRIKGVMAQPAEAAPAEKEALPAASEEAAAAEVVAEPAVETPTVKLPPRGRAAKAARAASAASTAAQVQPVVSLPSPSEPRGRGRGRSEIPRAARQAPVAAVESRDPDLPYHSSRVARSQSPPPAWRQYPIRLAPYPPRRPVAARVLKNFHSPGYPRPLYPFSWEPVLKDVNPRRLNRDEMLLPKKYDKNGVPIYVVVLPKRRFGARVARREVDAKPEITVSISNVALVRQAAPEPAAAPFEPAQPAPASEVVDAGFAPFGRGRGRGRVPESGSWRRADAADAPTVTLDAVQDAAEPSEAASSLAQGGFHRALAKTGESPKFTGALNGEKVEATPRKETTAPGRDANGLGKAPSSPPYKPQDLSQATASPSAAAPWASKALTYSAIDPMAASVWSAAPEEGSVHARAIAASNLPENSLQGIVDEDPSEALPSSLAELKSEDGHSNADSKELAKPTVPKDEAKLRAAAPSFSSFLHESAAAVDPSTSPAAQHRLHQHPYPGFPAHIPPQSTPSPISAYSPAPQFSPHLYTQLPRPQQPPLYPSFPSQGASAFAAQPIHQAYSTSPFAPASPLPPTLGYPSPYRESPSPVVPHGITNPALIASYNFGHQAMPGAGAARGYGAVGATGGPPGPGPIGRPQHQQGPPGGGMYARPASYLGAGGGAPPQYGSPFQHGVPPQQQQPYRMDNFGSGDGRPPSQHGGGAYGAGTTMASPVIMPQQLPPVPLFSPGHGHHPALASPVSPAPGMGVYGPGAYGHGGAYQRGGGAPIGRGPPGGGALGAVGRW